MNRAHPGVETNLYPTDALVCYDRIVPGENPWDLHVLEQSISERRTRMIGVKMTASEAEASREAAFNERTTKSSLLRRLFIQHYLKRGDQEKETE